MSGFATLKTDAMHRTEKRSNDTELEEIGQKLGYDDAMQAGVFASYSGTAGSSGSATASGTASGNLRVAPARRRGVSARKPSWRRREFERGSRRQISPAMAELAEERLAGYHKLSVARRRAVFYAMQRLSRYDRATGARLAQHEFSSEKIGRFIHEGLVETGLAMCMDWYSWKPTGRNLRNATPRAFVPCCDLLFADTGSEVVSTFSDYCSGICEGRAPLHTESCLVFLNSDSGVQIPENVVSLLQSGTGMYCDFAAIPGVLLNLPETERSRTLCAALASTGRVQVDELAPLWKQHEWGRLYSSKPALVNMPKVLLATLRDVNGRHLWNVDFSSFEMRIASRSCGQSLPEGDAYGSLAECCGITRARVKKVINPMLHGQTKYQLWYAETPNHEAIADRPLVEKVMAQLYPKLFSGLDRLRQDRSILQRTGATIFFAAMGAALQRCGIAAAGVPKHDGWIFAGDESQAIDVCRIFEREAERVAGVRLPVTMGCVA
jgi:hypothetical protein